MTYDFDDGLAIPPVRPEPEQPTKTPCVGGPWSGANITHMPGDYAPRAAHGAAGVDSSKRPLYEYKGEYRYDRGNLAKGVGATWIWHPWVR